jgi:uncharacterized protein (DUF58 family)
MPPAGPPARDDRTRALLRRVRRAVALASRRSSAEAAGAYCSTFKGQGLDFAELGEYVAGDDVRHIDWSATARTGRAFVRRYHEDREGTVLLVVDRGATMNFGSGIERKAETAAQAAALLALLAVSNRDRVGLVTYGEAGPLSLAPAKGLTRAMRVVREVMQAGESVDRPFGLAEALNRAGRLLRRPAMVLLVGDFLAADGLEGLGVLAARHEVLTLAIRDPLERQLPVAGLVRIAGVGVVDTCDAGLRERYAAARRAAEVEVRQLLNRKGVGLVELEAGDDPLPAVMAWLRRRARQRQGW